MRKYKGAGLEDETLGLAISSTWWTSFLTLLLPLLPSCTRNLLTAIVKEQVSYPSAPTWLRSGSHFSYRCIKMSSSTSHFARTLYSMDFVFIMKYWDLPNNSARIVLCWPFHAHLDPPQARQDASARLFSRVHLGTSRLTLLSWSSKDLCSISSMDMYSQNEPTGATGR